ncbi:MAG: TlpA family protein disulfide reductase [Paludibacter sp.]|jgi:thiol-disulfide isomerase/thioredoxin|nr:TlpA family protein disulfide reductase [Paludibacter sp.]
MKYSLFIIISSFFVLFSQAQLSSYQFSPDRQRKAGDALSKKDSIMQTKINTPYNFEFKAVSLSGDTITNNDLKGKVTFINFWMEACAPCLAEKDDLVALYRTFRINSFFQFISFTKENSDIARSTVDKYHLPYSVYPIAMDCYRLNYQYGFPTSLIIGKDGNLKYFNSGMHLDKEKRAQMYKIYYDYIQKLLME